MAATPTVRNGSTLETASLPADNPALRWFALLTAAATFVLVWMGGLVTSHEAGLSVPDWPNTYGYNLFFFPISKWISGIFFEHTHRLVASGVGLMTTILALWLFGRKSRPLLRWGGAVLLLAGLAALFFNPQSAIPNPQSAPHSHLADDILLACIGLAALAASFVWPKCEPSPKWLRRLGVLAFIAVVAQGVLGGLRVTHAKGSTGDFPRDSGPTVLRADVRHRPVPLALLAQPAGACGNRRPGLALFLSGGDALDSRTVGPRRHHAPSTCRSGHPRFSRRLRQNLARHRPGSVPDTTSFGRRWMAMQPITAFQIVLQMVHRMMAATILLTVGACAWLARRQLGSQHRLSRLSSAWLWLIVAQIFLGAATIWTGKTADIATAHVACGALCLVTGALLSLISFRGLAAPARQNCPARTNELPALLTPSRIPHNS